MNNSENSFASSSTERDQLLNTIRESIPRVRRQLETLERMERDILVVEVKEARPSVAPPPSNPPRIIERLIIKS